MAGTRTAPAFSATPTGRLVTLHLIDASGDTFTQAFPIAVGAAAAVVESIAAEYQLATQASLYQITDTLLREGDADPDNAQALYRGSVKDGINLLMKNIATGVTITPRLIAPVAATMQGNQDIPLLSSTEMTNLILAMLAGLTGFSLQSAQYTERRERKNNSKIKA